MKLARNSIASYLFYCDNYIFLSVSYIQT